MMIYMVLVDKVLLMGKNQMQVKIMSERYEEINEMIHQNWIVEQHFIGQNPDIFIIKGF